LIFSKQLMTKISCCSPARDGQSDPPIAPNQYGLHAGVLCDIPGGNGLIGTDSPLIKIDGEAPQRKTKIKPFRMGQTPVKNCEFSTFIAKTGYVTEAEVFGWSFVFHLQVPKHVQTLQGSQGAQWWRRVDNATWQWPTGSEGPKCHPEHPAVHLSWNDAVAYCAWAGGRLPTEVEWEHAARGGLGNVTYPWGNTEPDDNDHLPCNIWQGQFPDTNTQKDGHAFTSPAQSFAPNGYGLYGMSGNVWDWSADMFRIKSMSKVGKIQAAAMRGYRIIKGGSYLCHASYCTRYRIAARTGNSPDSSTGHTSFRIVFNTAKA
jgi:sulfatase modifying factor 1